MRFVRNLMFNLGKLVPINLNTSFQFAKKDLSQTHFALISRHTLARFGNVQGFAAACSLNC